MQIGNKKDHIKRNEVTQFLEKVICENFSGSAGPVLISQKLMIRAVKKTYLDILTA